MWPEVDWEERPPPSSTLRLGKLNSKPPLAWRALHGGLPGPVHPNVKLLLCSTCMPPCQVWSVPGSLVFFKNYGKSMRTSAGGSTVSKTLLTASGLHSKAPENLITALWSKSCGLVPWLGYFYHSSWPEQT